MSRPVALRLCALAGLALGLPALPGPAQADVVVTRDGLTLEGQARRLAGGGVELTTERGVVTLRPEDVASLTPGEGPRAAWRRELAASRPEGAAAWYRLALTAQSRGLALEAREAFQQVLLGEPEHAAAHRALGHEKVDGLWLAADEARRRRGLVLYAGAWLLPAEVEVAQRAAATPAAVAPTAPSTDEVRRRTLLRAVAGSDEARAEAARRALTTESTPALVAAALALLGEPDAGLRRTCCRLLGEWGDESALRALVFHGARDLDPDVRREAVLAAASFGHDDTAVPFVRALGSQSLPLVANAAQALGLLADLRTAGYIVKRLRSHGSSTRNFVAFLNQVSYVRDYDVEIAQNSNIANPNIGTISDGVVLDVKVNDAAYTTTWVEPFMLGALSQIVGRPFADRAQAEAWYASEAARLPDFPQAPAARAPRRSEGKIIGLAPLR